MSRYGRIRRTNRRTSYRKKNRTLRSSNILTRKSATAQSRQILALKRKLNKIAYQNRPEVKVWDTAPTATPISFVFNNSALSKTHDAVRMLIPSYGVESSQRIGSSFKILSHVWNCHFRYSNDSTTGFHANMASCAVIRAVVIQFKSEKYMSTGVPPITELFSCGEAQDPASYNLLTVSPYIEGFSNEHRVLYDKMFYLTPDKPVRNMSIRVHPKHNLFNWPDTHGEDASQGTHPELKNYMALYILVSNLKWDTDFKETVNFSCQRKIAFTDS